MESLKESIGNKFANYLKKLLKHSIIKEDQINDQLIIKIVNAFNKAVVDNSIQKEEAINNEKPEHKENQALLGEIRSAILFSFSSGKEEDYKNPQEAISKLEEVEKFIKNNEKDPLPSLDINQQTAWQYSKKFGNKIKGKQARDLILKAILLVKNGLQDEANQAKQDNELKQKIVELTIDNQLTLEQLLEEVALRVIKLDDKEKQLKSLTARQKLETKSRRLEDYKNKLLDQNEVIKKVTQVGLYSEEEIKGMSISQLAIINEFCENSNYENSNNEFLYNTLLYNSDFAKIILSKTKEVQEKEKKNESDQPTFNIAAAINHRNNSHHIFPLSLAVMRATPEICKLLLEIGANPYKLDHLKQSALYYAIVDNKVEIIKIILNKMQEMEEKQKQERTDQSRFSVAAAINSKNGNQESPLTYAIKHNNTEIVELFSDYGVNKLSNKIKSSTAQSLDHIEKKDISK